MAETSTRTTYPYKVTRHYYSGSRRVEQSMDIYKPGREQADDHSKNRPVIVLVMGSGWLGHAWWIYAGTNWWNSSAPQMICGRLGYTCVSIRHSGAFFSLFAQMVLVAMAAAMFVPTNNVILSIILSLAILGFFYWQGQGAASLDDMVHDVSTALSYLHDSAREIGIPSDKKVVVGGYSSGAHVLATMLSKQQSLPMSKNNIAGVLYLSGVLSLESWFMNVITLSTFGKFTSQVPSPLFSSRPPSLPHLMVGCQSEVFGIPILDKTFCAQRYQEWLTKLGMDARCVLVDSNHWSVLSSSALCYALDTHLPWLYNDNTSTITPSQSGNNKLLVKRQESLTSTSTSTTSVPGLVCSTHVSMDEDDFVTN